VADSTENSESADDEAQALPLAASNLSWLHQSLWAGPPPSTDHLPKKTAKKISEPVPVPIPADLTEDDFTIEEIEILGVPEDASLSIGTQTGPDSWQLTPEQSQNLTITSESSDGEKVLLTFKAVGTEISSEARLTNMASAYIDVAEAKSIPPQPKTEDVLKAEKKIEKKARKEIERAAQEKIEKEEKEVAEKKAQKRAERKAKEKVERKEKERAERKAREKAERKAEEKAEKKALEKAERKAKEKEERKAKERAERKAKEKEERKAEERAERKAKEKEERKAQERAERKAKEKEERKAKERAERRAKEKAERKAKERADREARKAAEEAAEEARIKALTPGDLRTRTGTIAIRLGGAPEYGDPLYRISVDGRQIANGNVDWALGMPDIAEGEQRLICWQDVVIPWDFDALIPANLSITFENDHTWNGDTPENLIVDWVNIDGVEIKPDAPFAGASGGLVAWPKGEGYLAWSGELSFDVKSAFAGKAETSAPAAKPRRPLVIRVSDKDCTNPEVMAQFRALRKYLRGVDDPGSDANPPAQYTNLGLTEAGWRDLVILDPDGNAVSLDPVSPPFVIRVSASDTTDTDVITRLSGLRSFLRNYEKTDPEPRERSEFFKLGLAQKGWRDLLVLDPEGAAVSLPADQEEGPDGSEPEGRIGRAQGNEIKQKYLDELVKRAVDGMKQAAGAASAEPDENAATEQKPEIESDQPIRKRDARKMVKAFYGDALKHALDRLQASIGDDTDLPDAPPPDKASSGSGSSAHS